MPEFLLLRGAKQLLTLRGPSAARRGAALHDLSIIEDGSVLIRDGLIDNVGPTRRIENLKEARDAAELDVHGLVVMPGFADPGLRLNLLGSANTSGKPAKPRCITSFSSESAELLHSCLVHGTLNVQVKANAGVGGFRSDVSVLRQLAELGNKPVGMVRAWRIDALAEPAPDSALDYAASLQFLARRNLAHAVEIAVAADNGLSDRVWAAAGEKSLAVNLLWPGGSAELLSNLLQRASPASVYSSSNLSAAECQLLAESSALTVFSPNQEMAAEQSGDAACRIANAGGAIALSSGYDPECTRSVSMQMALTLAVLRLGLSPEQAISAATINAAYAMGIGNVTGSLELNKRADLLVLTVPDYREIPCRLGMNAVGVAIRGGTIVHNSIPLKGRIN